MLNVLLFDKLSFVFLMSIYQIPNIIMSACTYIIAAALNVFDLSGVSHILMATSASGAISVEKTSH